MTREGHDDDGRQEMSSSRTGMLEVQQAVKELETAAWREGIDPESLLGRSSWLRADCLLKRQACWREQRRRSARKSRRYGSLARSNLRK